MQIFHWSGKWPTCIQHASVSEHSVGCSNVNSILEIFFTWVWCYIPKIQDTKAWWQVELQSGQLSETLSPRNWDLAQREGPGLNPQYLGLGQQEGWSICFQSLFYVSLPPQDCRQPGGKWRRQTRIVIDLFLSYDVHITTACGWNWGPVIILGPWEVGKLQRQGRKTSISDSEFFVCVHDTGDWARLWHFLTFLW